MQLHELKPKHKLRKAKRIGRGGAHGFTSGKGSKGQRSRSGRKFKPEIRELIKKYPKLRGYKFKASDSFLVVLNVGDLEKKFESGEKISPRILIEKRMIRTMGARVPDVKILGAGEISKKISVEGCGVSKSAKEKIEKAGGTIK